MQNDKAHPISDIWWILNVSMSINWSPTLNNSGSLTNVPLFPISIHLVVMETARMLGTTRESERRRDGGWGTQGKKCLKVAHRLKVGDDNCSSLCPHVNNVKIIFVMLCFCIDPQIYRTWLLFRRFLAMSRPLIFHFLSCSLFLPERARWGERFLFSEASCTCLLFSLKAFNSWGVWFYREGASTSLPPPVFFRPSLFLWSTLTPSYFFLLFFPSQPLYSLPSSFWPFLSFKHFCCFSPSIQPILSWHSVYLPLHFIFKSIALLFGKMQC